jgi:hypothetical protein
MKVFDCSKDWIDKYGINANEQKTDITVAPGITMPLNSPQGYRMEGYVYYETLHQSRKMVAAKVGKVFTDRFQFIIEPGDIRIQLAAQDMLVYRVTLDVGGARVTPGLKYKDLKPGNTVFYRCQGDVVKDLVIYEDNR